MTADAFGERDPRNMPLHLFWGHERMDFSSAVKARIAKQNCSVCPRYWYVDASFVCERCNEPFSFSADEQRFWYEDLGFYVDSQPKYCRECRREVRELKSLRQEYDRNVAAALLRNCPTERKQRIVAIVDALIDGGVELPERMVENQKTLIRQIDQSE